MSVEIVNDALKYYDSNNEKYRSIKKRLRYVKFADVDKKDIEGLKLVFFDEDMNELFVSRVEILGKYYNNINTWLWGWSLPGINKSLTSIIRKVFLYGTDIDLNNNPANIMLKNELVTSRFRIDNEIQLDIHCAIASYLAKKPFVLAWKDLIFNQDGPTEMKGDDYEGDTDVTYYTFIIDPPEVDQD
ncbi:hypothetical protein YASMINEVIRUS_454 [Yasminevirus sp. GU-2018]|uniref:Uncharacterized protein n=1 Tax=Yasminevirus sp. GU-2018 TaxID=2420051 RepID=A0A5K0U8W6_9VIRU|nr:hypothetical protein YASMINEVIRUS_454 [Yasminevirus sp. GU-2018]